MTLSPRFVAIVGTLLLAGCAASPRLAPSRPAPPVHVASPPPRAVEWRDQPLTPGTWRYDPTATVARFGPAGAPALVSIGCDRAAHRVTLALAHAGTTATVLAVETSYGRQQWPAAMQGGEVAVVVAASDPALDSIAFSRGHVSFAAGANQPIVTPAWAEPARVVEDCRASAQ